MPTRFGTGAGVLCAHAYRCERKYRCGKSRFFFFTKKKKYSKLDARTHTHTDTNPSPLHPPPPDGDRVAADVAGRAGALLAQVACCEQLAQVRHSWELEPQGKCSCWLVEGEAGGRAGGWPAGVVSGWLAVHTHTHANTHADTHSSSKKNGRVQLNETWGCGG